MPKKVIWSFKFITIVLTPMTWWHIRVQADMILQMLSNAKFLITNKTLVRPLSVVNVHVILKCCFWEELRGTDLAIKRHHCSILLTRVCFNVYLVAFCFCKCFKAVVTSVKGSACFYRLHCSYKEKNVLVSKTNLTLYALTSVCIFSILFSTHFLRC